MKILVDLQPCQSGSRLGGIGRYSWNLFAAMTRNAGTHDLHVLLNGLMREGHSDLHTSLLKLIPPQNIHIFKALDSVSETGVKNNFLTKASEVIRERFIELIKPDVTFVSSLIEGLHDNTTTSIGRYANTAPTAVILYDLIPLMMQDSYLTEKTTREHYFEKINEMSRADLLLAISEYSRLEGTENLDIDPKKIINISSAADEMFRPIETTATDEKCIRDKFNISGDFLLYTASFDQRKNQERLIKAFAKLPKSTRAGLQLVIVGRGWPGVFDYYTKIAKDSGLAPSDVVFANSITDAELLIMYNLCKLFVFPSLREGFGLPVLEAMSCGTPAIGSNTTSVPEVIGCADALFDPGSVESISTKMSEVLQDDNFISRLRQHALEHSKNFSWDLSAQKALQALEQLVAEHKNKDDKQEDKSTTSLADMCITDIANTPHAASAREIDIRKTSQSIFQLEIAESRLHRTKKHNPNIGFITTWNTKCGIASYSKHLTNGMQTSVRVFAPYSHELIQADSDNVCRCWEIEGTDLKTLERSLDDFATDVIVIQFNYGFFDLSIFSEFIYLQLHLGRTVLVTLHSTADIKNEYPNKDLRVLSGALNECQAILVHDSADINRLNSIGVFNAEIFPHGILDYTLKSRTKNKNERFVVASYGFFLPNKGLIELIHAIKIISDENIGIMLKMYNAEYPVNESTNLINQARKLITDLHIQDRVSLNSNYLSDEESIDCLSEADLVVYPYQKTGESASGAVRFGLASGTPVAVTPLPIFHDISPAVLFLPGATPNEIASGLKSIMIELKQNSKLITDTAANASSLLSERRYSSIAKKLTEKVASSYIFDA